MKIKISISIVLIIFFVYFINNEKSIVNPTISSELIPIKEELIQLQEGEKFKQLSEVERLDKTIIILDKIPDTERRLKHYYKMAISPLPEIRFHGRVVDQYGQPVKNASVWYSGENAFLSTGGGRGTVKTDDDGYFMIDTIGAALELGAIAHSEIDDVSYQTPTRNINSTRNVQENTVRFLQHDNDKYVLNWKNYTNKSNPYIVNVWRIEKYEGAIRGGASLRIFSDGRKYTLKFDETKSKKKLQEGEKKGQLYINCIRPHMENRRDYGDWKISIVPVDGGIQETDDLYLNLAPEYGYSSRLDIEMNEDNENYSDKLNNKRYYFTANEGKSFGSLFIQFQPFYNHKKEVCNIRIKYKVNLTSSRNLAVNTDL